jgi:hypothetical protein
LSEHDGWQQLSFVDFPRRNEKSFLFDIVANQRNGLDVDK